MTQSSVSDELVEMAWEAFESTPMGAHYSQAMRAALETVAPALIAQGMLEAAQSACLDCGAAQTIEARAQELEALNARLVGIIDFMAAANAMQAAGMRQEEKGRRRDIGPPGPDPFGGRSP